MAEPDQDAARAQPDGPAVPAGQQPWAPAEPQVAMLYARVLGGNVGATQIWFDQRVLDRYRAQAGTRVLRTDTAGRVRAAAGWALDFGIAPDERLIHASAADLAQRLPPPERQHWTSHLVTLPLSRVFLIMRLGAGSCMDDGEVRAW
jgi:hypothetical protein